MKKTISILTLLLIIATSLFFNQERIFYYILEERSSMNMQTNIIDELPDGLHAILCGAGSPIPDPNRAGPCTAVIAGNQLYIVDSGSGSARKLLAYKIPAGQIQAVLLTHFHSDHIEGLSETILNRWVNMFGETQITPAIIYGPPGVQDVVAGLNLMMKHDTQYRLTHHGKSVLQSSGAGAKAVTFELPKEGEIKIIIQEGELSISAIAVDHQPVDPSVGYRFDYKGRSIVISGDTKKSENLEKLSMNVDLLIHEALNKEMAQAIGQTALSNNLPRLHTITAIDIPNYHTSPVEAAEIARDAKVGHLLFNHIVPMVVGPTKGIFAKGVSEIFPNYTVGEDGSMVTLPANSKNIKVGKAKNNFELF